MSQVKRYAIDSDGMPYPLDTGDYVRHSDYAALAAENERLRNLFEELESPWLSKNIIDMAYAEKHRVQVENLKDENERLRKAVSYIDGQANTYKLTDFRAKEGGSK